MTCKLVASKCDVERGRVTEGGLRDPPTEPIIINEQHICINVKQPIRNRPIVSIETEVHKRQFISSKHISREPTKEFVIT